MPPVAGRFLLAVPGLGLWLDRALLGTEVVGAYEGRTLRVEFPSHDQDFGLDHPQSDVSALAGHGAGKDDEQAEGVAVVRVTVEAEAAFRFDDFDDRDRAPTREAIDLLESLKAQAHSFLNALLHDLRGHLGHHWMGTSTDPVEMVWIADLLEMETGRRFPVGPAMRSIHHVLPLDRRLTEAEVAEAMERVDSDTEPRLAGTLLADARYLAWIRQPRDLRLAVLLAAIACEATIRTVLPECAQEGQILLVDLVLDNPRDVSMAMVTHLDKTARAVTGRSLREEDKDLFKDAERLFETRNKIAHGKAAQPTDDEMAQAVRAAGGVIEWLDGLLPTI